MSNTLSAAARTEFDSMVKQAFQGVGVLDKCVTVRNNVVGDTYKFRKMGKGLANQKSTSDLVTPMDVSHSLATATLSNWNAPEYTDIFDQAEVNFDEKMELASCIAGALGRRKDQLIIDAMDASTPDASDIAAGAANLTLAKIIQAKTDLLDQGCTGQLYAAINAAGLDAMLGDTTITSTDYANVKALVQGDIDTFMGFKFKVIESRSEGGLTVASNIVDSWFFHKEAVGLAIGIDMKTEVNYVPERTAWLSNGVMKAGSVVRDTGGLIKVQYDQTA